MSDTKIRHVTPVLSFLSNYHFRKIFWIAWFKSNTNCPQNKLGNPIGCGDTVLISRVLERKLYISVFIQLLNLNSRQLISLPGAFVVGHLVLPRDICPEVLRGPPRFHNNFFPTFQKKHISYVSTRLYHDFIPTYAPVKLFCPHPTKWKIFLVLIIFFSKWPFHL